MKGSIMQTLTHAACPCKAIVIDKAFLWGLEDGLAGKSLYDGYDLFCGQKFLSYERGWNLAQAGQQRQAETKATEPLSEAALMDQALAEFRASKPEQPAPVIYEPQRDEPGYAESLQSWLY
jgi:hypothetical protein